MGVLKLKALLGKLLLEFAPELVLLSLHLVQVILLLVVHHQRCEVDKPLFDIFDDVAALAVEQVGIKINLVAHDHGYCLMDPVEARLLLSHSLGREVVGQLASSLLGFLCGLLLLLLLLPLGVLVALFACLLDHVDQIIDFVCGVLVSRRRLEIGQHQLVFGDLWDLKEGIEKPSQFGHALL